MDYKEVKKKTEQFNKRWNISDKISYEYEFTKFKIRILNTFYDVDEKVTTDGIIQFCQIFSISIPIEYQNNIRYAKFILNVLHNINNEKQFYYVLQVIAWLSFRYIEGLENYFKQLLEIIELSNINLAITMKDGDIILYPRGEKEFDTKLVNEVLSFLKGNSNKHFIDALKFYQQGTKQSSIKSAESLRRALEEFLRFKLNNNKGLKNNIEEIRRKLKIIDKDTTIRNIIFQVFDYIDNYFNENSKHQDGDIDERENEYLIYQVGVLMRYINRTI